MFGDKKKIRAIVLMSGGLDSMLAAKLLTIQGVEVTPVCFESYFFSCDGAKKSAQDIGIDLRAVDISVPQLETVKRPRFGRGAGANSCIDCHLLMLKTAKEIMDREGFDFVATGEVLGQRPMSQNSQSLDLIEKESTLSGKLLRPLSAKLLPPTDAEKSGLIDRQALEGISGRSRNRQLTLAKEFGITDIPQPAGGCILTEPDFAKKIKKLTENNPDFTGNDAQILRYGRLFWEDKALFVVARDKNDCQKLKDLRQAGDWLAEPQNFSGPTVLIRDFGKRTPKETIGSLAKKYVLQYSKKLPLTPEISVVTIDN